MKRELASAMAAVAFTGLQAAPAKGPLVIHPDNPRYFMAAGDRQNRAVYLTGSHTHFVFQDAIMPGSDKINYDQDCSPSKEDPNSKPWNDCYLDYLEYYGHNFTRGWAWEQACWAPWIKEELRFRPVIYERTGPGLALDGEPKFDLTQFNPAYFDRLSKRIIAAGQRGIYVSVMLFEGWSIEKKYGDEGPNPWRGHPYHRDNNINGVDGDRDGDDQGRETHTPRQHSV